MSLKNCKKSTKESRYLKSNVDYSSHVSPLRNDEKNKDENNSDSLDFLDDFELDDLKQNGIVEDLDQNGIVEDLDQNGLGCDLKDSDPLKNINCQYFNENPDELIILSFFNDFTLMDIGIGDFIREVYFED
ncbi:hypothetical protein [Methanobrevibacter olleyae]|uniref:Uncharacterized protein n=1 Tax=Methanobrevibacter olleyae TaxID=294671 RepID=A0A126R071_METOL|nr:hypothetical protein [Methanobrevibacter olleyae]AMK15691.1 hypothetical protein YLM1_1134 [Methanobrevibacter olleyae]SFL22971.1 hypothetical protein SAMN02910297_00277 [Methanobrevibacter olleyae]